MSDAGSQDLVKWLRSATLTPTQPLSGQSFEFLARKSPHEELFYGMMEEIGCLRDYDGNFTVIDGTNFIFTSGFKLGVTKSFGA